ncbi:MAG: hypothetical protein EOO28_11410 [Comamonadaceae bacterium]|nr:MAG: hypothetical protein EOO28_11410 [Comamonadaceae bacterium]
MRYFKTGVLAAAALVCASGSAQTIERVRLTDNDLSCAQIYAEAQQMDTMIQLAGAMPNTPVPAYPANAYPAPYPTAQAAPQQRLSATQLAVLNHPNNANLSAEQKATLIAQTGMAEARGNAAVGALYGNNAPQNNFAFQGAVMADPQVRASIARARAAGMSDQQIAATLGVGMQRAGLPQMAAPAQAPSAGQAYAQAGGLAGMLNSGMSAQGGSGPAAAGIAGLFGAIANAAREPSPPQAAPAMPVTQVAPQPSQPNTGRQAQARKEHLTSMFLSRGCKLADVKN